MYFLAHFDRRLRLIVFPAVRIIFGERPCWISTNMASKMKLDRSGMSGMSILSGIKFIYLALLDPKL